ncbi:MAG TPA: hypothetical protein VMD91_10960 [Candidatus Sulfotelmatobacter sp.]|nr:hypothetical protein [Candidatus Sulfotelmatobacter sp.]
MDVTRAIADLDEVRSRLASVQRFRGLSGPAALASGIGALGTGLVQLAVAPHPQGADDAARYVAIWIACLAFALAVNYGALAVWMAHNWTSRTRTELRTAALAVLPAVVAGGAFTSALLARDQVGLLPGTWALCYALGLLAARTMLPRGTAAVAIFFGAIGTALLFAAGTAALAWWVMPLTFGCGQIAIGVLIARDAERRPEMAP